MATLWRKTMYHLGLAPEEEYDDYDDGSADSYDDDSYESDQYGEGDINEAYDAPEPSPSTSFPRRTRTRQPRVAGRADRPEQSALGPVRTIRTSETPDPGLSPEPPPQRPQVVRPVPIASNAKPHTVAPISFNDAQELADKFKGNQPVIMNLQSADRDLARRLIDFASGLCYGVGGQMEKVANHVYLLTPTNVEVSAEERRRMEEQDFSDR